MRTPKLGLGVGQSAFFCKPQSSPPYLLVAVSAASRVRIGEKDAVWRDGTLALPRLIRYPFPLAEFLEIPQ